MNLSSDEELKQQHQPEAITERLSTQPKPSTLPDAVLGGIDGCVTTFAVVSGTLGAGFSPIIALTLGFANLFSDAFSMAVSNYEANKTKAELLERTRLTEAEHISRIPEGEKEEIRQIFQEKGFSGKVLEEIVETISRNPTVWVEIMLREEHGLQTAPIQPIRPALATFGAFVLVGSIPLTPFLIPGIESQSQFVASALLAAMMFFLIGLLKSRVLAKPPIWSGIKTLLTGCTAASLAFITGYVLQTLL